MLAPTKAWPDSGVSVALATIGMRFLSATIQIVFTYEAGVIGAVTSTLTGTTAPFSAIGGVSGLLKAEPAFMGRAPKARLRPSSTGSCRPRGGGAGRRPGRP